MAKPRELSGTETAALIAALSDTSASVRLAALRAIVRLPLARDTWIEVSRQVESLLETKLEGDTFNALTANGIPFAELIEAAVFVPTLSVREILRRMVADKNPQMRSLVAHALATTRDPAAIPQLLLELSEGTETGRLEAAKSLSMMSAQLIPEDTVKLVGEAYDKETDQDVRFWLALTLAVFGVPDEIHENLNGLRYKALALKELYGDPSQFIKQLRKRGPFQDNVREMLQKFAAGYEDFTSEAALTLYEAQQPQQQSESPASPTPTPSSPPDPEVTSLALTMAEQIEETGELKVELNQQVISELLAHLAPDLETRAVTVLFKTALNQKIGWPGNGIVTGVHDLGHPFIPDVEGLFECYRIAMKPFGPDEERFDKNSLRWQIAWTAARASQAEILQVMGPSLKAADELERKLAAQLVEDSTVSSYQSYPPIFGGGSAPDDVTPGTLQLIGTEDKKGGQLDDSRGYIREMRTGDSERSGKPPTGGKPPASRTQSIEPDPSWKSAKPPDRYERAEEPRYKELDSEDAEGEAPTRKSSHDYKNDAGGFEKAGRFERAEAKEDASASTREEKTYSDVDRASPDSARSRGFPPVSRSVAPQKVPPNKVINTGFANRERPAVELLNTMPLKTGEKYFFWLDRSVPDEKTTAEVSRVDLPKAVPIGAELTVAVFGFQDGIQVQPGGDVGKLVVRLGRDFEVIKQPSPESPGSGPLSKTRLFFPVQMPAQAGDARMRCNIYWKQTLLQSRLLTVHVMKQPKPVPTGKAILSILDYKLTHELDAAYLRQLPEQKLSILLNSNGNGTNSFHLLGSDGNDIFKQDDLRFGEGELQSMITAARGTLRNASWNKTTEWVDEQKTPYKYKDGEKQLKRLKDDLINLARWGYGFYTKVHRRFVSVKGQDPTAAAAAFEKLLLEPAIVELAMKESPAYVLPGAMIYDYPLDATAGPGVYSLCPTFEQAFNQNEALETTECFKGKCPSRTQDTVVCPSGFWGFRHYLGMPLSVEDGLAAPATIDVKEPLKMAVGVATNMSFLKKHTDAMRLLRAGMGWEYADNRDKVFAAMKSSPHVVYFYCHGGYIRDQEPYLQVGAGTAEDPGTIVQSNLFAKNIVWNDPRPLVFINGCHTTAVEPQQALEFISPLITHSNGAGVIGTEITIFEELATVFAQECMRRFYAGETIGEAIRNSRLKLLSSGNPLGLVYIPFVKSSLKINYLN